MEEDRMSMEPAAPTTPKGERPYGVLKVLALVAALITIVGMAAYCNRPRRPHRAAKATHVAVVHKAVPRPHRVAAVVPQPTCTCVCNRPVRK